jgi:signal transduction histidine kinase
MLTDPAFVPWRHEALRRGYASSIALPLKADGKAFGALTIYCTEPDPFSAEEVTLLTDLADDLAYGIHVLRLRDAHDRSVAALREADRRKDEFLATLSHELRTPLSAIVGWSQMLLSGRLDEPTRRRAVEAIARNATAQSQIVNDVLDVSRIVQGKVVLDVKDVDLVDVMGQAIESVRHAMDSKRVRLEVSASTDLRVSADPARLQQVFWNLLSNAARFTPEEGVISVAIARGDGCVTLRVTDSGIGIAPEFLPCVFDRFSQANASVSRKHPGLGLGLAIVRHLVELHGGTIKAESAGEGQGATFTITLPVRAMRPNAAPGTVDAPPGDTVPAGKNVFEEGARLDGLRILVVDDEADAREMVKTVLELRGARATTVASTSAALEALHIATFDVLVADIGMPEEDGYALISQVRKRCTIPAIALTAYGRDEDRARALAAGYQQHLTKPAMPATIVTAVASLVKPRT